MNLTHFGFQPLIWERKKPFSCSWLRSGWKGVPFALLALGWPGQGVRELSCHMAAGTSLRLSAGTQAHTVKD